MKKLLLVILVTNVISGCSEPNNTLSFEMKTTDEKYSETIKDAASILSQLCPPAKNANSVNAIYQSDVVDGNDGMLGYRSEKYGWSYDVEFSVKDEKTGHTHWIYIGGNDDGVNGFLVAGKQESLDFCNIDATMKDNYFLPISISQN